MPTKKEAYDPVRLKHSDCLLDAARAVLKLANKMDLATAILEKRCPRHPEVKPVVVDARATISKMVKLATDAATLANKLRQEGDDLNAESLEMPNPFAGLAGMLMPNPFGPRPDPDNQEEG